MEAQTHFVSVVIPAYNSAAFISETLESALAQSFSNREVIVVNDGSPDTPELERALAPYRDRIIYLTQPNTGVSAARNRAIRAARGRYIALLDSDDIWTPNYLAAQMHILNADPTLDLLYSNGVVFGASPHAGRELMDISPSDGEVTFESLLREDCTVLTSCVVARRERLLEVGLFDESFRRAEDFDLWLRIAFAGGRIAYHREVLVRHRRRGGSLASDSTAMARGAIEVLRNIEATLELTNEQQALVRNQIANCEAYIMLEEARRFFIKRNYRQSLDALRRSIAIEPNRRKRLRLNIVQLGLRLAPRLLHRAYKLSNRGSARHAPQQTHGADTREEANL